MIQPLVGAGTGRERKRAFLLWLRRVPPGLLYAAGEHVLTFITIKRYNILKHFVRRLTTARAAECARSSVFQWFYI